MIRKISILVLLAAINCNVVFANWAIQDDSLKTLSPEPVHVAQSMTITKMLSNYHYRKTHFGDSLSSVILDRYFEMLDPGKVYFLSSDIKKFNEYSDQLDNQLPIGDVSPAYEIFDVFKRRYFNRLNEVEKLIANHEFDFTEDEFYDTDAEEKEWTKSAKELNITWTKIIKSQLLSFKLTGKPIEEAKAALTKRYSRYKSIIEKYKSEDVFQLYMNALSGSFDPHTSYFSPSSADNFEINMSRSLEGIGARLFTENDYTVVSEIIFGGPASKSNAIHKDDKITGIRQGKDGEYVDVIGWRIDEVVKLIRGPKGTTVMLTIISAEDGANALPHEIALVREKIKLEDQSVKTEVVPLSHDGHTFNLGVIDIPAFYIDFEAYRQGKEDYSSTTRDVRAALQGLKAQKVDGVIIDLRRNGGGSLAEAIELSGLFMKEGPMVQIRSAEGEIEEGNDPDPGIAYDGPLAVLTSHASASASEIFAGAIQDYKRGIVIGDQTYGKGTVQNLISLEQYVGPQYKELAGKLKLTRAKYYRVTGNTTQHLGVHPDIRLPSAYNPDEIGESAEPGALPWDKIRSADFQATNDIDDKLIDDLNNRYTVRLKTDDSLKNLLADIAELKKLRENQIVSLNESVRIKERDEAEKRRESRTKSLGKLTKEGDATEEKVGEKEDPYLNQGLVILADLISEKEHVLK